MERKTKLQKKRRKDGKKEKSKSRKIQKSHEQENN